MPSYKTCRVGACILVCAAWLPLWLWGCGVDGSGELGQSQERVMDLSRWIDTVDGDLVTFVALDGITGQVIRHNPVRARQPFIPASTFKIPHALIALDLGILEGPDHPLERPQEAAPPEGTSSPAVTTLAAAISNSLVWYFQEVARRVGSAQMAAKLAELDYGNGKMGPDLERFWLDGDLRISADEQVDFLRRFWSGELPVGEGAVRTVREMLVLDDSPGRMVWGKTGTTGPGPEGPILWLVGVWEHSPDHVTFFALNLQGTAAGARWGNPEARVGLVQRLLRAVERE